MKTAILLPVLMILAAMAALPGNAQQVEAGDRAETAVPDEPVTDPPAMSDHREDSEPATRFTPSEKIRADDALSFPVDI